MWKLLRSCPSFLQSPFTLFTFLVLFYSHIHSYAKCQFWDTQPNENLAAGFYGLFSHKPPSFPLPFCIVFFPHRYQIMYEYPWTERLRAREAPTNFFLYKLPRVGYELKWAGVRLICTGCNGGFFSLLGEFGKVHVAPRIHKIFSKASTRHILT